MTRSRWMPMLQAIIAAILFGASTPLIKLLMGGGGADPLPTAALMYLGCGVGLLALEPFRRAIMKRHRGELPAHALAKKDIKWLAAATLSGGTLGPILFFYSLSRTPASTAALLSNFEGIATAIIAAAIFREPVGRRVWTALAIIAPACVLLTLNIDGQWGFSLGALGVLAATTLWAADNNFSRNVSGSDPFAVIILKGLVAGALTGGFIFAAGVAMPPLWTSLAIMLIGFASYGVGLIFFMLALRGLGAARATAFLGVAPFVGATLSLTLLRETPSITFYIALPLMAAGAAVLLSERHGHPHFHERLFHEHSHRHDDEHHLHDHDGAAAEPDRKHSHPHEHEPLEHDHPHAPDIHHRHGHTKD